MNRPRPVGVDLLGDEAGRRDRAELRELADLYCYALDHRRRDLFAAMFCTDAWLVMPYPPGDPRPPVTLDASDGWARAFGVLDRFVATIHQVAYQFVDVDGDEGSGETVGVANEVHLRSGARWLRTRGVRYADTYRRVDGRWRYLTRAMSFDWVDDRKLPVPFAPDAQEAAP